MHPIVRVVIVTLALLAALTLTVYAATLSHAAAPCCPGGVCLPPTKTAAPLAIKGLKTAEQPPAPPRTTKGVNPAKRVNPAPVPADLAAAIAACESDKAAVATAQANIATAEATLAAVQKQITAAQAASDAGQVKLSTDATALMALLAQLYPIGPVPPTPSPPVPTPPVSGVKLLEVGLTTCGPCNSMDATIALLVAAKYDVSRIDCDKDPTAANLWKPAAYPTLIMLVDGTEVTRTTGTLSFTEIQTWIDATVAWAKTHFPGEKP